MFSRNALLVKTCMTLCFILGGSYFSSLSYGQGADFDPVGILTSTRAKRELFVSGDFGFRGSLLSEEAWLNYIDWNLDLGEETGVSYLVYYAGAGQYGSQGNPTNSTGNGNANVILGWTPVNQNPSRPGGFIFHYLNVGQLSNTNGIAFAQSMGLSSLISDSPVNSDSFRAIAWHQEFLDGVIQTRIGQLEPTSLFNVNSYASDDTRAFLSSPLSAEPSRTTPGAGVSAAVVAEMLDNVYLGGAIADANGQGNFLEFHSFAKGDYMTNLYLAWQPTLCGMGPGLYQIALYSIDATTSNSYSRGIGINLEQNLNDNWAVFFKYNQSEKRQPDIRKSAACGLMCLSPFDWNQDLMGIGTAWSEPTDQSRRDEYVIESFWRMQITPTIQVTPDVQFWLNPSQTPADDFQAAFTIRALIEL